MTHGRNLVPRRGIEPRPPTFSGSRSTSELHEAIGGGGRI
jgi:hypothetical protein